MKKAMLTLFTFITIPLFMNNGIAKADGSVDYMLNCPPREFNRCYSEYQANRDSGWQSIKNIYNSMLSGCNRKDVNQCFAHYSSDFQVRQSNGEVINLEQLRQANRQFWRQTGEYRESVYIIRRDVGREYAKVMGIEYVDAIVFDANNSPVPMRIEATFEQTWRRTSNGWKLAYQNNLDSKVSRSRTSPGVPSTGSGIGFDTGAPANFIREAGNGFSRVR
ncbi:hypothetical protein CLI64_07910 [Nostoc sp. CENA543]|uniref:hypothetical protein n=1 Tax=Nostoc sp. CENA543 TaxID=1869241 RepID=UPI000CA271B1|nr:hypothetical protein [Nostoc sp. CENA543]AUT00315.1 hypothetical protein CLI64_07910 [Nostoc sp. CENA543]